MHIPEWEGPLSRCTAVVQYENGVPICHSPSVEMNGEEYPVAYTVCGHRINGGEREMRSDFRSPEYEMCPECWSNVGLP